MRRLCFISIITFCIVIISGNYGYGQGFVYGFKAGPTIGIQQWSSFTRDALFKYHGDVFIESLGEEEEDKNFSLFATAGYHIRGSAIRTDASEYFDVNTGTWRPIERRRQEFRFNNLSVAVGGKNKYEFGDQLKGYYLFGLRGEYTVSTNLDQYEQEGNPFSLLNYPTNMGVQDFLFGISVGGGFEFPFTENFGGVIEFVVQPDFSRQYYRPPLRNVPNPFQPGQLRNYAEEEIRNVSFELSLGLRFLRRIEYIDEDKIGEDDMW